MESNRVCVFPADYTLLDGDVDALPRVAPLSPEGPSVGIRMGGREFSLVLPFGEGQYGSGVFLATTPDPETLLVGALGEAYLVALNEPVRVTSLDCFAASACAAFPKVGALVVVDFTRVICVATHGVAWVSSELSDDAIRLVGQDDRHIVLRTYSAADGGWLTRRLPISLEEPL